jgi:hypothetical protein
MRARGPPSPVYFLDELDLLGARPALQLLFPRDGLFDVVEKFLIDEVVRFVFLLSPS